MKFYANVVSWIFGLMLFQLSIREISSNSNNTAAFCKELSKSEEESQILCGNVTDPIDVTEEFENFLKNNPVRNVKQRTIEFRNMSIKTFPESTFHNLSFHRITFRDNTLEKIDKLLFQDSNNTAKHVDFSRNNFTAEFNIEFLQPLRDLYQVEFFRNNLVSIPDDGFGDLPSLELISIRYNNLVKIGKRAFASLPHLKSLKFDRNNIEKLEDEMFDTSKNLESIELDLSYNEIREIEPNAFAGLKAQTVNLEYNNLTTLTQGAFEPLLESMHNVYIKGVSMKSPKIQVQKNPFNCDLSIAWLIEKPFSYRDRVDGCPCI